jgi:hypothetical protein
LKAPWVRQMLLSIVVLQPVWAFQPLTFILARRSRCEWSGVEGTFGYIISFGTTSPAAPRVLQFGDRFNF